MRRANTTFVNLRATLDDLDAARRRVQAGGQEAAAVPRRAAAAGPRRAADAARPVGARSARPGARQRPHRADAARPCRCATSRVGTGAAQRQAPRGRVPGARRRRCGRDARARATPGRTRRTSSAGSTTSATRASTTRSAAAAGPRLHVNLFAQRRGVLMPPLDATTASKALGQGRAPTSATAARAPPSAADGLQADARLPLRRVPEAARPVRRALVILALVLGAARAT